MTNERVEIITSVQRPAALEFGEEAAAGGRVAGAGCECVGGGAGGRDSSEPAVWLAAPAACAAADRLCAGADLSAASRKSLNADHSDTRSGRICIASIGDPLSAWIPLCRTSRMGRKQTHAGLFDHLVGAGWQRERTVRPKFTPF